MPIRGNGSHKIQMDIVDERLCHGQPKGNADFSSAVWAQPANVRAIRPVGYFDMVMLERDAPLIATDSGGVEKQA